MEIRKVILTFSIMSLEALRIKDVRQVFTKNLDALFSRSGFEGI
jgi:hypothetical protein